MKSVSLIVIIVAVVLSAQAQLLTRDLQSDIDQAQDQSFENSENRLNPWIEQLETEIQSDNHPWLHYWKAYAHYQSGIFEMVFKQDQLAQDQFNAGIALLEAMEDPPSEHLTLLASLYSITIQYHPGEAVIRSAKAKKLNTKAIKKDPNNLRAHLSLGRSDYYKPVEYGGGREVEKHLLKALSLKDRYNQDHLFPSWGRDGALEILIRYYLREGRKQEARLYAARAEKLYPNHYYFNEVQKYLNP